MYLFLWCVCLFPDAARKARALAEEAFFQPSIMSHLYLPLEHHFAIYAVNDLIICVLIFGCVHYFYMYFWLMLVLHQPFFVPVLLHTVLAAVREGRRYIKRRKAFLLGQRKGWITFQLCMAFREYGKLFEHLFLCSLIEWVCSIGRGARALSDHAWKVILKSIPFFFQKL